MRNPLVFPIVVLCIGLFLAFSEIFIPSGGLIGLLALGCICVSVWEAFQISMRTGMAFLAVLGVTLPIFSMIMLVVWPRTWLGRKFALQPPAPEDVAANGEHEPGHGPATASKHNLEQLIGLWGRTVTTLRPLGAVEVNGHRWDALAEEGMIAPGTLVRVISHRHLQLVVRAVPADLPQPAGPAATLPHSQAAAATRPTVTESPGLVLTKRQDDQPTPTPGITVSPAAVPVALAAADFALEPIPSRPAHARPAQLLDSDLGAGLGLGLDLGLKPSAPPTSHAPTAHPPVPGADADPAVNPAGNTKPTPVLSKSLEDTSWMDPR